MNPAGIAVRNGHSDFVVWRQQKVKNGWQDYEPVQTRHTCNAAFITEGFKPVESYLRMVAVFGANCL